MLEWCKKCGDHYWSDDGCKCSMFYFKHEDWGDEPQEIHAKDFKDAALKFATNYNEDGDYNLMNNEMDVVISDGNTEKTFKVSAEASIEYYAEEC